MLWPPSPQRRRNSARHSTSSPLAACHIVLTREQQHRCSTVPDSATRCTRMAWTRSASSSGPHSPCRSSGGDIASASRSSASAHDELGLSEWSGAGLSSPVLPGCTSSEGQAGFFCHRCLLPCPMSVSGWLESIPVCALNLLALPGFFCGVQVVTQAADPIPGRRVQSRI